MQRFPKRHGLQTFAALIKIVSRIDRGVLFDNFFKNHK